MAGAAGMQQACEALGIKPGDESFTKAGHLWEMMDEMASNDPEGYQAFVRKQSEDHKKMMKENAPPTPVFCVRTTDAETKKVVVVNYSESKRVKAPDPKDESLIPMVVQEPSEELDQMGKMVWLYEAVVHPKVMKKVKADDEYKRAIVEIGLTSVEARAKEQKTPGAKLDRAKMKVKEKPLKCRTMEEKLQDAARAAKTTASAPFEMKMPGEAPPQAAPGSAMPPGTKKVGGSVLDQLGSISPGADGGSSSGGSSGAGGDVGVAPTITIPGLGGDGSSGGGAKKGGVAVVIEEIASGGGGLKDTASGILVPKYTVAKDDEKSTVVVKVELPEVASVSEIILDISKNGLTLEVPAKYRLECSFPCSIDHESEETVASFKKKRTPRYLELRLPIAL